MQNKLLKNYLADVILTIEEIEFFAKDFSIEVYNILKNKWAVERGLSIVGKALYKADKLQAALAITNLKRLVATLHIIIHDYDIVDPARIYIIVQKHFALIKTRS